MDKKDCLLSSKNGPHALPEISTDFHALSSAFQISPRSTEQQEALQLKIDQKTKPLHALGQLEILALQLGQIQQTLTPQIKNPTLFLFAADHGIAQSGVSAYPQEVTRQMVLNFLAGGAAVNVFCRQNGWDWKIIDAGVCGELPADANLISAKIAQGTRNLLIEAAMTPNQCTQAISVGAQLIRDYHAQGGNLIGLGEMGIGNTSSASLLTSRLLNVPLKDCLGRGTGLDESGLAHKQRLLQQGLEFHQNIQNPWEVLATFGGFELAMLCGAALQAAELQITILVDGFIVSAALLPALLSYPHLVDYCIFAHCSREPGHRHLLDAIGATPLLDLNLALGEGSGAALALPLLESAVRFLNEMASFESAGVSQACP